MTVAIKDKMDLAIGVAVGSSMRVPCSTHPTARHHRLGHGHQGNEHQLRPLPGRRHLFVSVLLVNYLIGDGKSHWLEGQLLICLYFIIAVCAW